MRLAVAYSTRDPVGKAASRLLVELAGGEEAECPGAVECYRLSTGAYLAGFNEDVVELEMIGETPDPGAEAVVVLSRHRAESGRKSLTVHHTGNPGKAAYGGEPGTLSISYPALSRLLLQKYREKAEEAGIAGEYSIVLEATHHGPTSPGRPLVFIEVGSTPEEWRDTRALRAMAETVLEALKGEPPMCKPAAGFGGTHYPEKFTRIHLEGEYCLGHIIPKYAFQQGVEASVIVQAVEKTYPQPAEVALIEKKSLKSSHKKLIEQVLGSRVEILKV
ncbi:MAG: D-aminoacyl-tRNA deacylase [Desulfurococcales archaeon]|nr:D-aminoacyl-tRNA deacylase [Desulfurococcales archaeon]